MLANLKIGQRLSLLLALLVLLSVGIGLLCLGAIRASNDSLERIYQNRVVTLHRLKTIGDMYSFGIIDAARAVKAGSRSWEQGIAEVERDEARIEQEWGSRALGPVTPREAELRERVGARMAEARRVIGQLETILRGRDSNALAVWVDETSYPALEPVVEVLSQLTNLHMELAAAEHESAAAWYRHVRNLTLAALLLSVLLSVFLGGWIIRDLVRSLRGVTVEAERISSGDLADAGDQSPRADEIGVLRRAFGRMRENLLLLITQVQRSGVQVNTSATEIAATAREQQITASEVSATTLQVGATAREISATSKQLVRTMDELAESGERMAALAASGQEGLSQMDSTMRQITDASGTISARFAVLNDRAANINTVVTTISKVADQTNLLSLNAAIEAEKAGEYGRGFSVVASEIRRLADQTALATTEIDQMIGEVRAAVSAGVMGMDRFSDEVRRGVATVSEVGEQLSEIIQLVQDVAPRFEMVVAGVQSQSEGAEQISEGLAQLGEASKQAVESLLQSTTAIDQLNDAARGLQDGMARFRLTR